MRRTTSLVFAAALAGALLLGSGCSSSGSKADFCSSARDVQVANTAVDGATGLPAEQKALAELKTKIDDAVDAAPSEIKADVQKLSDAFAKVSGAAAKAKTEADLKAALGPLSTDKSVQAASDKVTAYTVKNCKDLSS
jgi:Skp family chaperone for outer membrane proteins